MLQCVYTAIATIANRRGYSVSSSTEVAGLDWSPERLIPAFQSPDRLEIYNVGGASRDALLAITTLVGLINRPQPKVYLILGNDEEFWLKEVFSSIPQIFSPASKDNALDALLDAYHTSVQGLIVYDPNLDDSINIATMIAAQRNGVAVSPAQVQALQKKYNFSILADLRVHGWKSRLQAYQWAFENLRSGCSSHLVAGIDFKNVNLRSFLVATRTFIYTLDSRNYLPDFNGLLHAERFSERELMKQIFGSFQPGAVHLGWFMDESSGVKLASQRGICILATDHFANLEVWTSVQPTSRAPSISSPIAGIDRPADETNTVYVSFTISDGDNLQYSQHRMKNIWRDDARGSIPIGWTISPSLMHVAPALAEYYRASATLNDELIAGPSGAGYMFPSHWPPEHLDYFLQRTGQQMQAMGITTLEVLDADCLKSSGLPLISQLNPSMIFSHNDRQKSFARTLRPFGLRGILSGAGKRKSDWKMIDDVPFYQNLGLAGSVSGTVGLIKNAVAKHAQRPLFLNVYILAWNMTPSDLKRVVQQLDKGYEIVLPKTLLAMLAETMA